MGVSVEISLQKHTRVLQNGSWNKFAVCLKLCNTGRDLHEAKFTNLTDAKFTKLTKIKSNLSITFLLLLYY